MGVERVAVLPIELAEYDQFLEIFAKGVSVACDRTGHEGTLEDADEQDMEFAHMTGVPFKCFLCEWRQKPLALMSFDDVESLPHKRGAHAIPFFVQSGAVCEVILRETVQDEQLDLWWERCKREVMKKQSLIFPFLY